MAEQKQTVEATVRNIRRATRKKYTAEEKVRIVLEGLRGERTIAELCRKEVVQRMMGAGQIVFVKYINIGCNYQLTFGVNRP